MAMYPPALKYAWFALSLLGTLSCVVVLRAFAVSTNQPWGVFIYMVGTVILELAFCCGIFWRMNPLIMPRGFCIAQVILIDFGASIITASCAIFTLATAFSVFGPRRRRGLPTTTLAWHPIYLPLLIGYPLIATGIHLAFILKWNAIDPREDDMHCDANHPLWTRLTGYAGMPLLLAVPCFILSTATALRIWRTHHAKMLSRSPSSGLGLLRAIFNVPTPPSTAAQHPTIRSFSCKEPVADALHSPTGMQFHVPFSSSLQRRDSEAEMPAFVSVTHDAFDYGPYHPPVFAPRNKLRRTLSADSLVAGPSNSHSDLSPTSKRRISLIPSAELSDASLRPSSFSHKKFTRTGGAERRPSTADSEIVAPSTSSYDTVAKFRFFRKPRSRPTTPDSEMVASSTTMHQSVLTPWLKVPRPQTSNSSTSYFTAPDQPPAPLRDGKRPETADSEHLPPSSGCETLGEKLETGQHPVIRRYTPDELTLTLNEEIRTYEYRASRSYHPDRRRPNESNLANAIWRIILFQIAFFLTEILASISTLVDLAMHHTKPATFGTQHVALLMAAWGPFVVFGHLPAVRSLLAQWFCAPFRP